MNKELEDAIKLLNEMRDNCLNGKYYDDKARYYKAEAISTILDYIENSISKEKLQEIIDENLRKDTIMEHTGYLYGFNECQYITRKIVELLEGK